MTKITESVLFLFSPPMHKQHELKKNSTTEIFQPSFDTSLFTDTETNFLQKFIFEHK